MRLRQILASRPELFPDERDRVQMEDFHALVCQKKQLARHAVKDIRVGVIQVPLIRVKGGPNPLTRILNPGKCAGVFVREDFAQVDLIQIRDSPVGVDAIHRFIASLTCLSAPGPRVLVRSVVDDQVQHQADTFHSQRAG